MPCLCSRLCLPRIAVPPLASLPGFVMQTPAALKSHPSPPRALAAVMAALHTKPFAPGAAAGASEALASTAASAGAAARRGGVGEEGAVPGSVKAKGRKRKASKEAAGRHRALEGREGANRRRLDGHAGNQQRRIGFQEVTRGNKSGQKKSASTWACFETERTSR